VQTQISSGYNNTITKER